MRPLHHGLVRQFLATLAASTELVELGEELAVPFQIDGRNVELDAAYLVRLLGRETENELAVTVLTTAYPRDVRNVVARLAAFEAMRRHMFPHRNLVPVVVADQLSTGARDRFRQAGISYFDRSGTLYFRTSGVFCDIQRESRRPVERRLGSMFNGAREQVVHALLMTCQREASERWLTGTELAALSQTSPYTVSVTMRELEAQEWVEVTGSGPTQRRRLRNAPALLDAWANAWTQRARTETRTRGFLYVSGHNRLVGELAQRLSTQDGWMLTGAAAANLIAPHLTSVDRVTLVGVPGLAAALAAATQMEVVDSGSNVVIVEREGASMLFTQRRSEFGDAVLASPYVQYLDLLDGVGRNRELAVELRRSVLRVDEQT